MCDKQVDPKEPINTAEQARYHEQAKVVYASTKDCGEDSRKLSMKEDVISSIRRAERERIKLLRLHRLNELMTKHPEIVEMIELMREQSLIY